MDWSQVKDLVFEYSQDILFCVDSCKVIRYVSPTVETVLGYDPLDIIGKSVNHFSYPTEESQQEVHESNNDVFTSLVRHKSGAYVWLETTLKGAKVHDGERIIIGISRDISERKKSETRLRDVEERYQSLLTNNPDGICALDTNGRFVEVNPAACKIGGYCLEELLGVRYEEILFAQDVQFTRRLFHNAFCSELTDISMKIKHRSGHEVHILAKSVPIIQQGKSSGVYVIFKDMTRQRETEEFLRNSEKLSALGQLAAGVAHEIKNPLTTLKGFTQLFKEKNRVKEEYIDLMLGELNRIEAITNEMLVLSKPKELKFQLKDVKSVLRDVITLLEPQANLVNVEIHIGYDQTAMMIRCEEVQIKQVFLNIIKNAIEAMPSGGVLEIDVRIEGTTVVVFFVDQGSGIPAENLPKLGDPFFTTKESGTGLGLMVSQRIMGDHSGSFHINSEVGRGTVIGLVFPLAGVS